MQEDKCISRPRALPTQGSFVVLRCVHSTPNLWTVFIMKVYFEWMVCFLQ